MRHREPKSEIDDTGQILQGASCTIAAAAVSEAEIRILKKVKSKLRAERNGYTVPMGCAKGIICKFIFSLYEYTRNIQTDSKTVLKTSNIQL
jgi:hypothetical protein